MLVEKTILAVDVATIEVRVDQRTEKSFEQIVRGKDYSPTLERALAERMFAAESAVVELTFLRSISLDQYITGVRESLEEAHRAGKIDAALRDQVSAGLPTWFSSMKASGFIEGDRVLYKVTRDRLRTVVVTQRRSVTVDRTDEGDDKRMILLGCYFAPGTSYREPLLRSIGN